MPGWSLNETTDVLLKKEFDDCREKQVPHRIFTKFGLTNVVPFSHEDLDKWRDSLRHGLEYQIEGTNIILHGGIDDVWHDQTADALIVVDYKSQASQHAVEERIYLARLPSGIQDSARRLCLFARTNVLQRFTNGLFLCV